jgi:hypothetical protein
MTDDHRDRAGSDLSRRGRDAPRSLVDKRRTS